jgi:endonuclease/exonuclease/phosphatase (EEP) superfamily protein YafD
MPICHRGRKNTAHQYSESLDIIREMVSKYSKSHTIVLGGDFNASLHREPPNNIDKMPRACCSEAGLITPDNYPVKPTFYHHDNKSSSQIDYLFTLEDQIKDGIRAIKI